MREVIKEFEEDLLKIDGLETGFFGVERGDWMEEMEKSEKRPGFSDRLKESKKMKVLFCVMSMCVLFGGYFLSNRLIQNARDKKIVKGTNISTDGKILSDIENIVNKDGVIMLDGWALHLDSQTKKVRLVLSAINGSDSIVVNTQLNAHSITKYFNSSWNFGKCGFSAVIKDERVKPNICYEIFTVLDYELKTVNKDTLVSERKRVSTKKYLYNGELYAYDVNSFVAPEISNELLNTIISKGILCSYELNGNMYVYQYGDKLYWFMNTDYSDMEIKQYVPYHIHPFIVSALPDGFEKYGFENRDFYFEDKEVVLDGEVFRVAIAEIPTEYAVAYIETGLYSLRDSKWFWNERFQINVKELGRDE